MKEEEKMKDDKGDERDKEEDDNKLEVMASAYAFSLKGPQDSLPAFPPRTAPFSALSISMLRRVMS
jgi:hypothetical protein